MAFLLAFSHQAITQGYNFPIKYDFHTQVSDPVEYLEKQFKGKIDWQKDTVTTSPLGWHYLFSGYVDGIPVRDLQAKISLDRSGRTINIALPQVDIGLFEKAAHTETFVYQDWAKKNGWGDALHHTRPSWVFKDGSFEKGTLITVKSGLDFFEVALDSEGNVLDSLDRMVYSGPDSLVNTLVFAPDPLTTAEKDYGSPFIDSNDADIPELNIERVPVQITVRLDTVDSLWKLKSDYCVIMDIEGDPVPPATSDSGDFIFTRAEAGFEDVMCFFHINNMHNYLASIGHGELANFPLPTDPHAYTDDQSSFYEGYTFPGSVTSPALFFGTGGVDDAEDADVIIHEYGHAILYSASPGTNSGQERRAMDEGFGDYLAASYSLQFSPYNSSGIFNWDGHNEFWEGRYLNSDKTYPTGLNGNMYRDGTLWGTTLLDLNSLLGREKNDKILFASIYGYVSNMTMQDAAELYMQSMDSLFPDDPDRVLAETVLCDRGFLPGCEDTLEVYVPSNRPFLRNTAGLAANREAAFIDPNGYNILNIAIIDLRGRTMEKREVKDDLPLYPLYISALRQGLYMVVIETNEGIFMHKFVVPGEMK